MLAVEPISSGGSFRAHRGPVPSVVYFNTTRTDVYAVFGNPGKSGLMNLDWVQFDGK